MAFPVLLSFLEAGIFVLYTDLLHTYRLILMVLGGHLVSGCSLLLHAVMWNTAVTSPDTVCPRFTWDRCTWDRNTCNRYSLNVISPDCHKGIPFWESENCHSLSERSVCAAALDRETAQRLTQLFEDEQLERWEILLHPSQVLLHLWAGQSLLGALLSLWPLGTYASAQVLYTSAEQSVRRCAPREGCQESAATATTQHSSTKTAPADLVSQHYSFKNTLFPIVCSSILLSAAIQRLEIFGY